MLPIVRLVLRSTLKEHFSGTCAEMMYGATLSLPGEFLQPTNCSSQTDPSVFLQHLTNSMQELSPTAMSSRNKPFYYVQPSLETCTHVFVHNDITKASLTQPYNGPYPVQKKNSKHFTFLINGKDYDWN